jgi:hypothetical protein
LKWPLASPDPVTNPAHSSLNPFVAEFVPKTPLFTPTPTSGTTAFTFPAHSTPLNAANKPPSAVAAATTTKTQSIPIKTAAAATAAETSNNQPVKVQQKWVLTFL